MPHSAAQETLGHLAGAFQRPNFLLFVCVLDMTAVFAAECVFLLFAAAPPHLARVFRAVHPARPVEVLVLLKYLVAVLAMVGVFPQSAQLHSLDSVLKEADLLLKLRFLALGLEQLRA